MTEKKRSKQTNLIAKIDSGDPLDQAVADKAFNTVGTERDNALAVYIDAVVTTPYAYDYVDESLRRLEYWDKHAKAVRRFYSWTQH